MYNTVKELGLTINESTMVGLVKAPPTQSEGWVMFDLLTKYYHTETRNMVEISVPVMTRNPRDSAVIDNWVHPGKQLLVRGNFVTWDMGDGKLAVALVPHLIKLGPQVSEGTREMSNNSCLFIGRIIVAPVLNKVGDYNLLEIETEFVEKLDQGFSESVVTIPIAIPFKNEQNQQILQKLYTQGKQIMVVANYAFYRDMEGNVIPGFVSRIINTGNMK